jgi:tetratricopeptide (TPR) repeat protein
MTDELITDLSKISGLRAISRISSFTYKGKTVKVLQVADELNVKYMLEGSIQRAVDRVRIRAQLINGATDHHLWAESYDAVMENIFDLQDKITKKIAAILEVKLTAKEQNRLAKKETTNIQAYDAFVKGWDHLHRETPDDLIQAFSSFMEAIELDPMHSRAQAAAGMAYFIMGDLHKAATKTERAINHNPTIAGHYERLSAIYALLGRNQDAQAVYNKSLKDWNTLRFPANVTTVMALFFVKDRKVADRYAEGLVKAGWPGHPSQYYKIYE